MTLHTWLLFLVTETLLSLSPGPAVFYAVSHGLRGGARGTLPAALGVITANGIYFAVSATSLGALIAASPTFFHAARWVGAVYLVFLGIRTLLSLREDSATEVRFLPDASKKQDQHRVFQGALTLQLANPKALLFFIALLPQFIDTRASVVTQMLILALTSMLPEFFILLAYGWLAHRALLASTSLKMSQQTQRRLIMAEGLAMLACAAMIWRVSR